VDECALVLPIEKGTIQDGGANEVGEAFEAGLGGGRGDHGLFLVGEADIDLEPWTVPYFMRAISVLLSSLGRPQTLC
jgi:hypothetical protein